MLGERKARAGFQWTKMGRLLESKGDREESQKSQWRAPVGTVLELTRR